ncbi:MAG TPA: 50S ribosomal protein L22 [Candidatus Acidoferrales bacterium]|nr:50S ribosomal protein L22 [Candidatus Acidoferrales bacterium]
MEASATQRTIRQSPRKMRLVIDLIRGRTVPEADAILRFSKKLAARQIRKVLKSAVANAEQHAQRRNEALDVDQLRVAYAVVDEGTTLKRFTPAAMGRATPILKRTSHVAIRVVSALGQPAARRPAARGAAAKREPAAAGAAPARPKRAKQKGKT